MGIGNRGRDTTRRNGRVLPGGPYSDTHADSIPLPKRSAVRLDTRVQLIELVQSNAIRVGKGPAPVSFNHNMPGLAVRGSPRLGLGRWRRGRAGRFEDAELSETVAGRGTPEACVAVRADPGV